MSYKDDKGMHIGFDIIILSYVWNKAKSEIVYLFLLDLY